MLNVIAFEIRYRMRQATPYLFFAILFVLGFLTFTTEALQVVSGEAVKANAPTTIAVITVVLTVLGSIMVSGLMGTTIYRDFERRTYELFFTTPLTKRAYLIGRFIGSWIVTLAVFSGLLLGMPLGAAMPWVDHARFLPFQVMPFVSTFVVFIMPNLFLAGSLFFMVGALTRRLTTIYTAGILLFVGYILATNSLAQMDNRRLATLLDPFGLRALRETTRYWSVAEQNHNVIGFTGPILWNRLLWIGLAIGLFAMGYLLFDFSAQPRRLSFGLRRNRKSAATTSSARRAPMMPTFTPAASLSYRIGATYLRLCRFYFVQIIRSVTFRVILIAGMTFLFIQAWNSDQIFETPVWPVTRIIVAQVAGVFTQFFLILITFYAGELMWRERTVRLAQMTDALPVPTAVMGLAKITAVALLPATLNLLLCATGIVMQIVKGYYHFQLDLYFTYLYGVVFPQMALLTILAFFVHSLVNHKFIGHAAMIVFYVLIGLLPQINVEHNLLRLMYLPDIALSDMNGFGPFIQPFIAYCIYWGAFGGILIVATLRMWPRGVDTRLPIRWRAGKLNAGTKLAALLSAATFLISGGYIAYNTLVMNPFRTRESGIQDQVRYEKTYKPRFSNVPQPRITALDIDMDLHPEVRQYSVRGTLTLVNKTNAPIPEVFLTINRDLTIRSMRFDRETAPDIADKAIGVYSFKLKTPLPPGGEMHLQYEAAYDRTGFPNGAPNTSIVANGTFLSDFSPHIGYQPNGEITDVGERRKRKLPTRPRMAPVTDMTARRNTYLGNDADWIQYSATVRTAPDQIAISPGYLQREWMENGRRCFEYKMDAPIRYFVSVVSAKYQVRRDSWTGKDGKRVAIEIYYHPTHAFDLDRMVKGAKAALTYCSEQYTPYQFHQIRILEFPDYQQFAQSFPNTVPYSEGIGFIARVQDASPTRLGDIDNPFYVTAHEVAHQWWAHQVVGADTEGSEILSESLAEYSALMVMEHTYGREQMRRFLRIDLDRYLTGRSTEREGENPISRTQRQAYIHYAKGSLVFYGLRERLGEEKLNRVLAQFAREKGFQNPPYTTGQELVNAIRAASPPEMQNYLTELFDRITLFTNRALTAKAEKVGAKRWRVTLDTLTDKFTSDAKGNRTPAALDDWIEVGVYAKGLPGSNEPGRQLALKVVHVTQPKNRYVFEVDEEPAKAGINPNNKVIDLSPADHLCSVSSQ